MLLVNLIMQWSFLIIRSWRLSLRPAGGEGVCSSRTRSFAEAKCVWPESPNRCSSCSWSCSSPHIRTWHCYPTPHTDCRETSSLIFPKAYLSASLKILHIPRLLILAFFDIFSNFHPFFSVYSPHRTSTPVGCSSALESLDGARGTQTLDGRERRFVSFYIVFTSCKIFTLWSTFI